MMNSWRWRKLVRQRYERARVGEIKKMEDSFYCLFHHRFRNFSISYPGGAWTLSKAQGAP